MEYRDLVIIGAGPAGMGAALAALKHGIKDILILERGDKAGGILPQCVHSGFGLIRFGEELTGPEYARRFYKEIQDKNIELRLETMATDIKGYKTITAMSAKTGISEIKAKAVILAMGCRERTRGAINIPGTRPAGVLTAGAAQRFVNIEGYMPGKEIVILGSGDIGLIMARRLTLEGAKVKAVCEIMPKSSGLDRNISQCLNDFNIPLLLSHTVCDISGDDRVTGVTVAAVDGDLNPIEETKEYIPCDTLLLSVGLIPENELSQSAGVNLAKNGGAETDKHMRTNIEGIFACGNVVHVHDLADYVTEEGEEAGKNAAKYILGDKIDGEGYKFHEKGNDEGIAGEGKRITCIVCPIGCKISVSSGNGNITEITGNKCVRGKKYVVEELTAPKRVLTSTIRFNINGKKGFAPVKTSAPIPKGMLMDAMKEIKFTSVKKNMAAGEVIIKDLLETGIDIIATDDIQI